MFRAPFALVLMVIAAPVGLAQQAGEAEPTPVAEAVRIIPIAPASQDVIEALDSPVHLDLEAAPLKEAVRQISEQIEVPILIDQQSLDQFGLTAEAKVAGTFSNITARSALILLLRDLDLDFVVGGGFVRIMTYNDSEQAPSTRIYRYDFDVALDDLAKMLQSTVFPETWEQLGGPSTMSVLPRTLTITTTDAVHHEVAALLETLADVANRDRRAPDSYIADQLEPENRRIREALDKPSGVAAGSYALTELVTELREQTGVNVRLDRRAFEESGMNAETRVTVPADGLTVRQMFEQSNPRDVSYHVDREVLSVTTRDAAEANLATAVFDVRDLVFDARSPARDEGRDAAVENASPALRRPNVLGQIQPMMGGGMGPYSTFLGRARVEPWSAASLRALIVHTLHPDVWEEVGGPATIAPVPDLPALVVNAPEETLAQVGHLLDGLREAGGPVREEGRGDGVPQGYERRVLMSPFSQEELDRAIRQLVAPGSWEEPDVVLAFVGQHLVVQHRRDVVRQVEALLRQLVLPAGP